MPAYAAIATENGYIFCGGEPATEDPSKKARNQKSSVMDSTQEFVTNCGERALRFFQEVYIWDVPQKGEKVRDSHGRHGRKKVKARRLPH